MPWLAAQSTHDLIHRARLFDKRPLVNMPLVEAVKVANMGPRELTSLFQLLEHERVSDEDLPEDCSRAHDVNQLWLAGHSWCSGADKVRDHELGLNTLCTLMGAQVDAGLVEVEPLPTAVVLDGAPTRQLPVVFVELSLVRGKLSLARGDHSYLSNCPW